ncbi:hypothetical protein P0W64_20805 [Tsukamurella sp. 8F]|uniref:hypothetical protein n=1 Tax=unclassified Tsukamurella TaxID=2633480 RepID=UPI0023B8D67A|nr:MULTISPECIES: hypothetical protein [unclassified Tsukamurella]MDF0532097.1 hypothetical protein [Tsukamurella sp. 8J]MDF0589225.1 hypothetical protein [Tsukamurella sp. 8F]
MKSNQPLISSIHTRGIRTTDGIVDGDIRIASECDDEGSALATCRRGDDGEWHEILGARATLRTSADLPFYHAKLVSDLARHRLQTPFVFRFDAPDPGTARLQRSV